MDQETKTLIQNTINDNNLIIDDKSKVSIDDLIKSHTTWLTNYM